VRLIPSLRRFLPTLYLSATIVCDGSKVSHDVPLYRYGPPGRRTWTSMSAVSTAVSFRSILAMVSCWQRDLGAGILETRVRANVWTMMSADEARGYVYLPSARPPRFLLEAAGRATDCWIEFWSRWMRAPGKRVWHFQMFIKKKRKGIIGASLRQPPLDRNPGNRGIPSKPVCASSKQVRLRLRPA